MDLFKWTQLGRTAQTPRTGLPGRTRGSSSLALKNYLPYKLSWSRIEVCIQPRGLRRSAKTAGCKNLLPRGIGGGTSK